jgi:hypothetical protein
MSVNAGCKLPPSKAAVHRETVRKISDLAPYLCLGDL